MTQIRVPLLTVALVLCATLCILVQPAWAQLPVTFAAANPMHKARGFFVANELLNGNVLVAGGYDGSLAGPPNFADSEIYNLRSGKWKVISPMNRARAAPVSVRLKDGRVMVIGGFDEVFNVLNSAEIYNPRTDTWSLTAPMHDARAEDFVAVLLRGGKVLVAGGTASDGSALASAEIYDIATNTWSATGSMNVGRGEFSTVVLHEEDEEEGGVRVLAVGGIATDSTAIASAEI
jgi:hypothetical protein